MELFNNKGSWSLFHYKFFVLFLGLILCESDGTFSAVKVPGKLFVNSDGTSDIKVSKIT